MPNMYKALGSIIWYDKRENKKLFSGIEAQTYCNSKRGRSRRITNKFKAILRHIVNSSTVLATQQDLSLKINK